MSRKRKVNTDSEVESVVSYRDFFNSSVAKKLVKRHQEKEIYAFFKDLGLEDKEPENKYRDALAKY